jgi:hypothetical protein
MSFNQIAVCTNHAAHAVRFRRLDVHILVEAGSR